MDPERELFWDHLQRDIRQLRERIEDEVSGTTDPLWSVHRAVLELQGQVRDSRSHDERTLRGDRS